MNQATQRQQALAPLSRRSSQEVPWDMLIIGGGITGAGIAREAARRGLAVLLIEQKDFAWGTSSRSSKMVHGGLRYIASGDYKTTLLSVRERERMLNEAGGLVNEMHYVMPHYKGKFPPPWIFNTLLRVYDKLAGKRYFKYFKKDAFLNLNPGIKQEKFLGASQFSDAVTDDSRLVMRVLDEAIHDGACAINYLKAESLITNEQGLVVGAHLADTASDDSNNTYDVYAKVVVSATGAWADTLRMQASQQTERTFHKQIRPSRGSHLVVSQERLPLTQAYTFLHPVDKRAVFVFPWENRSVLGTTDLDNPPLGEEEVGITSAEVDYLLAATNDLFNHANLSREDVISTWAGVRPLISEGGDGKRVSPSKEKRDHSVWLDNNLVTVSGGKLTTFRLIALDVLKVCQQVLAFDDVDTKDLSSFNSEVFSNQTPTNTKFATLPASLQQRLQGFYGLQLDALLALAHDDDLAYVTDSNTIWAEIRFAARFEQVIHLDDLLLRRTRLGLILPHGAMTPLISDRLKQICQQELGWDEQKWQQEVDRYQELWQRYYHLPAA
ncbi:glycerol-3-phosphate dehydrogenase/oxidase [Psychrobacter sp. AOP22-C1-22]|uniref:glycerol-3-phosphate dehydrogenase/oxidase n=1 Tax=unclassified Psychrobacter TaxID=196806 RepID=UPI001787AF90|nr:MULTISPECIES: glycerol-3-phosphate dehydrogenase/oxidase [unclassified Psychrobacter]MDN5801464.1 glycerol-3-phosphate dehydrogenase/oxidase [Psychrobacter sp.]MBE0405697.1 glycerol-3-phosphate dehydrogenase/oxidase [Psychrobacter sp. FME6]MBE0445474.1 glycerol-3-phosphate dehydrogenase/oxidase [Psychrobacter sp. FME5]MDN5890710.1 glycerol-3-phosphate dehydrogenase/oxidase [Psychrobacter sp.]MDN5897884.1 glycerol-3-phosphate dehydrogenase/oxidase [Psychrobacter sp.]